MSRVSSSTYIKVEHRYHIIVQRCSNCDHADAAVCDNVGRYAEQVRHSKPGRGDVFAYVDMATETGDGGVAGVNDLCTVAKQCGVVEPCGYSGEL